MKKRLCFTLMLGIFALAGCIVVPRIIGVMVIGGAFRPKYSPARMEKIFVQDIELFTDIADYLKESEHTSFSMNSLTKRVEMDAEREQIQIDDGRVTEAINALLKSQFHTIHKTDNSIVFQRSKNMDFAQGIVFSVDGQEPKMQYLTTLKPLPETNWYYYEEDYNIWRVRNRN